MQAIVWGSGLLLIRAYRPQKGEHRGGRKPGTPNRTTVEAAILPLRRRRPASFVAAVLAVRPPVRLPPKAAAGALYDWKSEQLRIAFLLNVFPVAG